MASLSKSELECFFFRKSSTRSKIKPKDSLSHWLSQFTGDHFEVKHLVCEHYQWCGDEREPHLRELVSSDIQKQGVWDATTATPGKTSLENEFTCLWEILRLDFSNGPRSPVKHIMWSNVTLRSKLKVSNLSSWHLFSDCANLWCHVNS